MEHQRAANYTKAFDKHGESPKSLQWGSYRSAALRYKNLTADVDFAGKTVLDAGCGMGDILPYIYAKADNFEYLGVDPTASFVGTARKRYDGHRFEVLDPFAGTPPGAPFDVVLCSGVLNANGDGWLAERKRMIGRLFELATEVVAFNMAGSFAPATIGSTSRVAYADAQDIVDFCKTLTGKMVIRSNYHSKDFTVILYK